MIVVTIKIKIGVIIIKVKGIMTQMIIIIIIAIIMRTVINSCNHELQINKSKCDQISVRRGREKERENKG